MRFGLFLLWQDRPEADPRRVGADLLEQVRFVRDGFDLVLTGQHFLSEPWQMAQPIPWLGRIAAEAGEMRIGAGVLVVTLLNPVEVAENVATLDAICGGRFILGVALGYRSEEDAAFGLPERRLRVFTEKLDVIRRLLEGEAVTASGHGWLPASTAPASGSGQNLQHGRARRSGSARMPTRPSGGQPTSPIRG